MARNNNKKPAGGLVVGVTATVDMSNETVQAAALAAPTYTPRQLLNHDYVPYGENNNFPDLLLHISDISPLHSSLLKLLSTAIEGRGWTGTPEALAFIESIDEDLEDSLLSTIASQLAVFDGFALQVMFGKGNKKITKLNPLPLQRLRAGIPGPLGDVVTWRYSLDWTAHWTYKPIDYPNFDLTKLPSSTGALSDGSQVLYVKMSNPKSPFYPSPNYFTALKDILTDASLSTFSYSTVENCFRPSAGLIMPHEPNEELRNQQTHDVLAQHQGAENAGQPMIFFLGPDGEKPEFITNQQVVTADEYAWTADHVQKKIIFAHNVRNQALVGFAAGSGLSSTADELMTAYTTYQNTIVRKYQSKVVRELSRILKFNNISTEGFGILPFDPNEGIEKKAAESTTKAVVDSAPQNATPPENA